MEGWKDRRMEDWKIGRLDGWVEEWKKMQRKNVNRGYRKLTTWNDAIGYYAMTCKTFCKFPFVLQRVASQRIAPLIPSIETSRRATVVGR
jgi:hypothetical protein